jgi:hypothetical protein
MRGSGASEIRADDLIQLRPDLHPRSATLPCGTLRPGPGAPAAPHRGERRIAPNSFPALQAPLDVAKLKPICT